MTEEMVDKIVSLFLALAGLAALVAGHLTDGAETAALYVTVAGATGVVGLQVMAAVARTLTSSLTSLSGVSANGDSGTAGTSAAGAPVVIPPGGGK